MNLDRRRFLALSAAAAAASTLPADAQSAASHASASSKAGSLRVCFFTDTHTQPELDAERATALAFAKIKSLKPELCIQGGDHVYDMSAVPRERSIMLLDMYARTEHALDGIPIEHLIGNHDLFGRDPIANVATSDPLYGKKAFEQRFAARTYRSFDRKGYHFILLDSIQITPERDFDAFLDAEQIAWLKQDLAATAKGTPIVIACHVPLVSAVTQYAPPGDKITPGHTPGLMVSNTRDILPMLLEHNVIAVLQGHTHFNEVVTWHGIPFITSGAVSGNWWNGSRWGTPEGFTMLELAAGKVHWHYETYGWSSTAPHPDPYAMAIHRS